ncbi:hypothetical protein SAMN02745126_00576 [Enhydrobacter aerosaccus]|uniref:Uncharacterized protein n=1 Tax=Enhydrobacter aerosaccus TaxID=225324 RepID=A0A1T4JYX9_9HYPH|nr:hypothetical protein [Enhydrobacter aerosaccus]SJZ35245.1 hypothetical protein SAMN02745126_00576 [Enhydrobacter aerosaccus]
MKLLKKLWTHIGSTTALLLGGLGLLGAFGAAYVGRGRGTGDGDLIVSAPIVLLGALAYRSAKKRMLGQVPSTTLRRICEAVALLCIVALVCSTANFIKLMAIQPVHYVLIPAWVLIAYLFVGFRKPKEIGLN